MRRKAKDVLDLEAVWSSATLESIYGPIRLVLVIEGIPLTTQHRVEIMRLDPKIAALTEYLRHSQEHVADVADVSDAVRAHDEVEQTFGPEVGCHG